MGVASVAEITPEQLNTLSRGDFIEYNPVNPITPSGFQTLKRRLKAELERAHSIHYTVRATH
jgi:hypothetical protein